MVDVISAIEEVCKGRLCDVLGDATLLKVHDLLSDSLVYDWQNGFAGAPITFEQ